MVVRRGEIWWADFGEARGSKAAYRRPVVIVQDDFLNHSGLLTVVVVPLSSNLKRARLSTNIALRKTATGLAKDSVAICTQVEAMNREDLLERVGVLPKTELKLVEHGLLHTLGLFD